MWKVFCLLLFVHGEFVSCENFSWLKTGIIIEFENSLLEEILLPRSPTVKATDYQEVVSCLEFIKENLPTNVFISDPQLNQSRVNIVFPQCTIELDFLIDATKTCLKLEMSNYHKISMWLAAWVMITVSLGNFLCVWAILWFCKVLQEKCTQCHSTQENTGFETTTRNYHRRGQIKHHIWSQICGSAIEVV